MNKAYKIRLYPKKEQAELIEKTIGCSRFIYNQMLEERINIYEKFKDDKEKLYNYKYKTEKEYKKGFEFLGEASLRALQQSRIDLEKAFTNFFRGLKGDKFIGFPKFKSKKKSKWSYREPQVKRTSCDAIEVKGNRIKLNKLGWVKFRGLSKSFQGKIRSVTVTKLRTGNYEASIFVERENNFDKKKGNEIIGIDLGLKNFAVCSNGWKIKGIKDKLFQMEKKIKRQQKHLARKVKGSNRKEKCRRKLAGFYQYKTNYQDHFFWHLANFVVRAKPNRGTKC